MKVEIVGGPEDGATVEVPYGTPFINFPKPRPISSFLDETFLEERMDIITAPVYKTKVKFYVNYPKELM